MALRKGILGGVPTTTLAGTINNSVTSLTIADATGWTMAVPFVVTLEPGTTNEEQILVGTKSGTTFSNLTRGYANSGAKAHTASATCFVQHSFDPVLADEANQHASAATAVGDMLYYDGTKWVPIPHGTQGQVLTEGASPTFVPAWVLDAMFALFNNAGEIPVGAADNTPQMLTTPATTGLVLVANTGASLKMAWGQIPTAGYADLSVTQAKIADGIINVNKLAGNYAPIFQQESAPSAPIRPGTLWYKPSIAIWHGIANDGVTWVPLFSADLDRAGGQALNNPLILSPNVNTYTAITFPTEIADNFNFHVAGASDFTVPVGFGGLYALSTSIVNAGPGQGVFAAHFVNTGSGDGLIGEGTLNSVVPGPTGVTISDIVYLAPGNTFKVKMRNTDSTQNAQCLVQFTFTRISG